jgi:UDP-N-acetylglucosamine acyltransferase
VHQFSRIGDYAFIGGCAAVTADIIPFGSAVGNHAHLVGLNVVGLKRRNFSREAIHNLRAAYKTLFSNEVTFNERVECVRESFVNSPEVLRVLEFIDAAGSRPLMTPARNLK